MEMYFKYAKDITKASTFQKQKILSQMQNTLTKQEKSHFLQNLENNLCAKRLLQVYPNNPRKKTSTRNAFRRTDTSFQNRNTVSTDWQSSPTSTKNSSTKSTSYLSYLKIIKQKDK